MDILIQITVALLTTKFHAFIDVYDTDQMPAFKLREPRPPR